MVLEEKHWENKQTALSIIRVVLNDIKDRLDSGKWGAKETEIIPHWNNNDEIEKLVLQKKEEEKYDGPGSLLTVSLKDDIEAEYYGIKITNGNFSVNRDHLGKVRVYFYLDIDVVVNSGYFNKETFEKHFRVLVETFYNAIESVYR